MLDLPTTRPSLLIRLRDAQDHEAWWQFVHVYAPVVWRFSPHAGPHWAGRSD
jgi:RNA polymerase sigma-70 factor (ECF subfamily)